MNGAGSTSPSNREAIANRALGAGVRAMERYVNGDAMAWREAVGWFDIAYWNLSLDIADWEAKYDLPLEGK